MSSMSFHGGAQHQTGNEHHNASRVSVFPERKRFFVEEMNLPSDAFFRNTALRVPVEHFLKVRAVPCGTLEVLIF